MPTLVARNETATLGGIGLIYRNATIHVEVDQHTHWQGTRRGLIRTTRCRLLSKSYMQYQLHNGLNRRDLRGKRQEMLLFLSPRRESPAPPGSERHVVKCSKDEARRMRTALQVEDIRGAASTHPNRIVARERNDEARNRGTDRPVAEHSEPCAFGQWHRAKADAKARLPLLAPYLGHSRYSDTVYYVKGTAEPLRQTSGRASADDDIK